MPMHPQIQELVDKLAASDFQPIQALEPDAARARCVLPEAGQVQRTGPLLTGLLVLGADAGVRALAVLFAGLLTRALLLAGGRVRRSFWPTTIRSGLRIPFQRTRSR